MIEGEAIVSARRAIYDPQSGIRPQRFGENGSTATEQLALVLNEIELFRMAQMADLNAAANRLLETERASVVVVKAGTRGGTVHRPGRDPAIIPAYWSDNVFKIGSGDVFSAAFARYWGEEARDPIEAAEIASRCVAFYSDTRSLPLPQAEELPKLRRLVPGGKLGRIYLAGPFFSIGQRWLVEEIRSTLLSLGGEVFSPLHDVGHGFPKEVAPADLRELAQCRAVLAIADGADPGSLFEIGFARARDIPVVVLAESVHVRDLTMLIGSDCDVVDDFATAIYHVMWASMEKS
jgi:nucleoside 2-deoxyribosyltransferase